MRIFYSFLVLFTAAILFMVPYTEAAYDFSTDLKEDSFTSVTDVGETTDNLTLTHEVYDDDTSTLSILSDDASDAPILSAYDSDTHSVLIGGLTANTTRTLDISYDVDALSGWTAIDVVIERLNILWYLAIIAFIPLALVAVWKSR